MRLKLRTLMLAACASLALAACTENGPLSMERADTQATAPVAAPVEPVLVNPYTGASERITSSNLPPVPGAEYMPSAGSDGILSSPMRPVKIALLLPLTGKSAALGKAMQDAAVLALFDKYGTSGGANKVVLLTQDTGDSPGQAQQAAQKVLEQGAELIIGPVFSQSVEAVAPLANPKGVNIITFSNNPSIARDGVFLFGFMPDQQVRRVADYAVTHGINRFAALAPSNAFGNTVTAALDDQVTKRGGKVAPVALYNPDRPDLSQPVNTLENAFDGPNKNPFQALLIPEGGEGLHAAADAVAGSSIAKNNIRLLGTGAWDDLYTLRSKNVQSGWFAGVSPTQYKRFEDRFSRQYGYKPMRLASLAYDAVALATTLASSSRGPNFSMMALTDPVGYSAPANGIFRFRRDGTSERGLAVLEVTSSGFRELEPAPSSF